MIGSDNGLARYRWYVFIKSNDGIIYWRIYTSLGLNNCYKAREVNWKDIWFNIDGKWHGLKNGLVIYGDKNAVSWKLPEIVPERVLSSLSKETLLRPCLGSPPVTGRFPTQRASIAESMSMSWCQMIYKWKCMPCLEIMIKVRLFFRFPIEHRAIQP